jgi:hypothetical protein
VKVLIGCEHTGSVRRAFRERGHDAWSCDLLPASDGDPHHLQCDVIDALDQDWDLAIFHPDCTWLANSAAWAFRDGPYHQKVKPGTLVGVERRAARYRAIKFVIMLLNAPISRIAVENPIGALSRAIGRPQQIIQPWMFGADASKATCLWLKGLPPLESTRIIEPRNVRGRPRWANQTDSGQNRLPPSSDRWAKRAATYPGIAAAMAEQWGGEK